MAYAGTSARRGQKTGRATMGFSRKLAVLALAGVVVIAWPGQARAVSNTTITNISGFGDPLQGIKDELIFGITSRFRVFAAGQLAFIEVDELPELGPIFNS